MSEYAHGCRRTSNLWGLHAINFLLEISNRDEEQAEEFPEFPIVLSENLP